MESSRKTRAGSLVRIFATDGGPLYPLLGAWWDGIDSWIPSRWTVDGSLIDKDTITELDLVE